MIIRSRAPLRLGLAGGGTDVKPYCDKFGGYVLNATIDRYAYATIETLNNEVVQFIASDQQTEELKFVAEKLVLNGKLDLHKATYNHMVKHYNNGHLLSMKLSTFCDAPPGSGLGSSSTLVVAMVRAFSELLNLSLDDYAISSIAYKIERVDCELKGGRQDQYSAAFGGFNFMEFYDNERTVVTPLRVKNWIICELEASLVLFYTGVSRESAKIIEEQSNNVASGLINTIQAMHGIKHEAELMKKCILKGDFTGIIESLRQGWENKKRSAQTVSSTHIDNIYNTAISAGALAGKVSGAGGGGFILFFVPPEQKMNVVRALSQFDGEVSNCHFTKNGAQSWTI
jgi:D-glycero-alpha-D-manno-heptose-7-phosphate kinase